MMELIPTAPVYHIGIYRERGTLQPVEYYNKLPEAHQLDVCYVLDPMIATGGSAIAAVDILKEAGVPKIRFVSICVSESGVRALLDRHPDVEVYTAALDRELDAGGFIVPGLGDAGDRLFNTL